MTDTSRPKSKDKSLYWGLFIYAVCIIAFPPAKGGGEFLRIPSFALLLLILIQVIFPQFRFSKSANTLAVIAIVASAFTSKFLLFS